jgi:hypothetical protein
MERSWLPWKIRILTSNTTGRRDKSLSAIAKRHWGRYKDESESAPKYKNPEILRKRLSDTLNGQRNTPHLVAILEEEFGLPIAELRELVQEDRERKAQGKPIDRWEASDWNTVRVMSAAGRSEDEIQKWLESKRRARAAFS